MSRRLLACALLVLLAASLALASPAARAHVRAPVAERVTPLPAGANPAAQSAPAGTAQPDTSSGPSGGQWFLGAILVAIGVAGATLVLRVLRNMPPRPPPNR